MSHSEQSPWRQVRQWAEIRNISQILQFSETKMTIHCSKHCHIIFYWAVMDSTAFPGKTCPTLVGLVRFRFFVSQSEARCCQEKQRDLLMLFCFHLFQFTAKLPLQFVSSYNHIIYHGLKGRLKRKQ